ncbi:response regulator [Couchioplanes caeruleus]|uniref:response regulator n=1 Tax=Couchioplanes caeruleus TaxID=56438 RepID=UPI001FD3C53E|nr:response regulator transcription factor [Couchioplanes caeruleus]
MADDYPIILEGLRTLIEITPTLELVGAAATSAQAVEMASASGPDVVVMDIRMPDFSGIDATRRIVAARPDAKVLILTMLEHDDYVFAAIRAGAHGYLLKGSDPTTIAQAITAVASGQAVFGPGIASRIISYFAHPPPTIAGHPFPELTHRERQILALVAKGLGNAAIARALSIESKTVRNYVSNILAKLHAADRVEAIERAKEAGLG